MVGTRESSDGARDRTLAHVTRNRRPTHATRPAGLAWQRPIKLPRPVNPALIAHEKERADEFGNRIADTVTRFAGSMTFVYLHVIWCGCWIGFGVESYPYGLLTVIVSLQAIFRGIGEDAAAMREWSHLVGAVV